MPYSHDLKSFLAKDKDRNTINVSWEMLNTYLCFLISFICNEYCKKLLKMQRRITKFNGIYFVSIWFASEVFLWIYKVSTVSDIWCKLYFLLVFIFRIFVENDQYHVSFEQNITDFWQIWLRKNLTFWIWVIIFKN